MRMCRWLDTYRKTFLSTQHYWWISNVLGLHTEQAHGQQPLLQNKSSFAHKLSRKEKSPWHKTSGSYFRWKLFPKVCIKMCMEHWTYTGLKYLISNVTMDRRSMIFLLQLWNAACQFKMVIPNLKEACLIKHPLTVKRNNPSDDTFIGLRRMKEHARSKEVLAMGTLLQKKSALQYAHSNCVKKKKEEAAE